jgi:hypothetical protein
MSASDFARRTLAARIRAGFVTVQREKAGGQLVGRVSITDVGRALEGY